MACEPTRSTYIHIHVSLCRPWKHHTDAFSITFLGVMGEASVGVGVWVGYTCTNPVLAPSVLGEGLPLSAAVSHMAS